jgi:hypothetical protein
MVVSLVRLALKVVVLNDGEFMDVILLYLTMRTSVYLSWYNNHLKDVNRKTWCKDKHILNLMDKVEDSHGNPTLWQKLMTGDGPSAMCTPVYLFSVRNTLF